MVSRVGVWTNIYVVYVCTDTPAFELEPGITRIVVCPRSNGYSCMVSAERNRLMNERVPHHRVASGVPRDAQTPAIRPLPHVQTANACSDMSV